MQVNTQAGGRLELSELCLGAMNWGSLDSEAEGHAQIDMALDYGVNCVDTAEMYPVNPIAAETVGLSEEIIGRWFARTARRADVVLATKVSGSNGGFIREGRGFDGEIIRETIDASLSRLRTDYIDIYQLHWPNRGSYMFRQNWNYDPSGQNRIETLAHMRDVLAAMSEAVAAGKVRHFGLSNESAWGMASWLATARDMGAPEAVTIQNEYSLLCRMFDTDLAELCANEGVGLMAFSPLATGLLTGKYQGGNIPDGSRMSTQPDLGGRNSARVGAAVAAYLEIASRFDLDPVQMALAFCRSRPFMATAIFGARNKAQMERALGSVRVTLSDEVLAEITTAHKAHPLPY
ncbi:MAG: aldo/keto reductase [Rhodobacteraceae bacterium]|nr:aldo/keto reductase [Paracoccaceae bacterium]